MSFNGIESCPNTECLKDLVWENIKCLKFSELITLLNERFDAFARTLCCVEARIKAPVYGNFRGGNNTASAVTPAGALAIINNFTENTALTNDPFNIFVRVAGGVKVTKNGFYTMDAQMRVAPSGSSAVGTHLAGDGVWINGVFFGGMPDNENSASTTRTYQITTHYHFYLKAGDVIALAVRCHNLRTAFGGELGITYVGDTA